VLFLQARASMVGSEGMKPPDAGGEFRQVLMLRLAPVGEAR
jgi:hypothetical protein